MKRDPKILYKEVILKHSKEPVHFEKNESAQYQLDAYNPICGDRFSIYLDIEEGKISRLSFHGYGCSISKASTSILVQKLLGQELSKAEDICSQFLAVIRPPDGEKNVKGTDQDFQAFMPARDFPGRDKCATLSWDEMQAFLQALHS